MGPKHTQSPAAQQGNDPEVYVWRGLRDPRQKGNVKCCLTSRESTWRHFVIDSGHVRLRSELFADWFGDELARQLVSAYSGGCARQQRHGLTEQAGEKMARDIQQCFSAPLVLIYMRLGAEGGNRGTYWRLPLPNGCRMIAKEASRNAVLNTCFFSREVTNALLPGYRWQIELRTTVLDYAEIDKEPGERRLLPKHGMRIKRRADRKLVWDTNIKFVEPRVWGYDGERPGARWSLPDVYPAPTARARQQLDPRYRPTEES